MTDAQPKKRQYQLSSKQKAKLAANRAAKAAQKKVEQAEKKVQAARVKAQQAKARARTKAQAAEDIAGKLNGDTSKGAIVTGEDLKTAGSTALERAMAAEDAEIVFQPNPGPQTDFLASSEKEVLYGGAAGGGKSYSMLIDPLRYAHNKNHRALLLRRSMPELLELIDISRQLYPKAFPGCKFREVEKRWMFPSGATLQFSFVDSDQDVYRFQGQAYTWIGIDEITQYPTPFVWDYLRSRLRTTDPDIIPYMRATANPGGVGGYWVKKMFVDPQEPGQSFWATDIETDEVLRYPNSEYVPEELRGKPTFRRKFIPAKLSDNPYLMKSPEYLSMLASLPETQRKRLLEGDWDIADDTAFPEFNRSVHTIEPFDIPPEWHRYRACDYGYTAPTAVLWFAVDFHGNAYVYRELYQKLLDAEQLSERIIQAEWEDPREIVGVLDTECWANRGQVGPSIAEVMINAGVRWVKADKGPGSRLNGKREVHRRLSTSNPAGKPTLFIFDTCKELIRIMPALPLDAHNPEDVDTKYPEDHLYDALRYGLMSRQVNTYLHPSERDWQNRQENFQPSDPDFGY